MGNYEIGNQQLFDIALVSVLSLTLTASATLVHYLATF